MMILELPMYGRICVVREVLTDRHEEQPANHDMYVHFADHAVRRRSKSGGTAAGCEHRAEIL